MQEFDLGHTLVRLPDADQNFPKVLALAGDASQVRLQIDIAADLSWFRGHFPTHPVLPGVIQLHWAALVAQACFELQTFPTEIKRLKFKHVMSPGQRVELTLTLRPEAEVQFIYESAEARYSEGRLCFGEAAEC